MAHKNGEASLLERYTNPKTIVVVGEPGVGKTSLVQTFYKRSIKLKIHHEDAIDVYQCQYGFKNVMRFLELVDIPSDIENFKHYRKRFYDEADAIIFMFDLTRAETVRDLKRKWFKEAALFVENNCLPVVVLGNKNDMTKMSEFPIAVEDIKKTFTKGNDTVVMDVSCNNAADIIHLFIAIFKMIFPPQN